MFDGDETQSAIPGRPVKGRPAKQARSIKTRESILSAAVELIAEKGIAGLTHRLVAERAAVPLAATTYYYANKFDIVADAANETRQRYLTAFERAASRFRSGEAGPGGLRGFILKMLRNAGSVHRSGTIAWAEISLDAVRHPESLAISRLWSADLRALWTDVATAAGASDPAEATRAGMDTTTGLIFMTLALGLGRDDINRVFVDGIDPIEAWAHCARSPRRPRPKPKAESRKSAETKAKILQAAIETLIADGAAAVSFREIARRTGMATGAPGYHYESIEELLRLAQTRLFEESKMRYRTALADGAPRTVDFEGLVDMTSVILQREITESGRQHLATFAIWMEATRRPDLRPLIWSAVIDQCGAWNRVLDPFSSHRHPSSGLIAQAMFAGKLIRVLALGAVTADMVGLRSELARDLRALLDGRFWALPEVVTKATAKSLGRRSK